jgi:hypothetical protein
LVSATYFLAGLITLLPISQTSFSSLPITDDPQLFFSLAAMVVSLIAVVAAFLLAKENKIAHRIWLVALVVLSFAEAFGYSSRIPSTGDSATPQVHLHESRSFPYVGPLPISPLI